MFQAYGGNGYLVRLYRAYFEARRSLGDMWYGNPVLTTVLFGLPLGFLSLILYSMCCQDILDAEEEDNGKCIDNKVAWRCDAFGRIFCGRFIKTPGLGLNLISKIHS